MDQAHTSTPPTDKNGASLTPVEDSDIPSELPLTPQSTNKGISINTISDNEVPELRQNKQSTSSSPAGQGIEASLCNTSPEDQEHLKEYTRNMSALSTSTVGSQSSYEEVQEPETPKSSGALLSSVSNNNKKGMKEVQSSITLDASLLSENTTAVPPQQTLVPSKLTVDWLPQTSAKSSVQSGTTNHSVRGEDDVTETSFTTMTTAGDMNISGTAAATVDRLPSRPVATNNTNRAQNNIARSSSLLRSSPRPPRHMRAVDWCPTEDSNNNINSSSSNSRLGNTGSSSAQLASDVTARAVRLGDEATVTTFATMTTMGDAMGDASILEVDSEDETSSSDDDNQDEGSQSMEDAHEEDGVVDKIPSHKYGKTKSSLSGTTNHAVKASDDQSVVTFATMTTAGGINMENTNTQEQQQDMVDKVPSIQRVTDNTSIITHDTVQMGDNESLATWATSNTMGGQFTGHVVDHVPNEGITTEGGAAGDGGAGDGGEADTIGTSNAVKDDPSTMTWTTAAGTSAGESAIQEVCDAIPTFAGGGTGIGTGRSVVSGVTSQAIRVIPDDRSVASFGTMTTMGDLGSIIETEVLEYDDVRPRLFSDAIDRAVVDVIPEAGSSVASGTTNRSVRSEDECSATTFGTMTTAGRDRNESENEQVDQHEDVVDKIPLYPNENGTSIVSGTTNHAVRGTDDQSVATWITTASNVKGHINEHIVDQTPPSFKDADQSMISEATNFAVKDADDQSAVTWNTMTTAGIRPPAPPSTAQPYTVDRVPSFNKGQQPSAAGRSIVSGITNQAVQMNDDQSYTSFGTGVGDSSFLDSSNNNRRMSGSNNNMVDRIPSSAASAMSGKTDNAVRLGDDLTEATFGTLTTTGGDRSDENDEATGILRESRYSRPVSRSTSDSQMAGSIEQNSMPIDAGESVSNTHILRAIADLRLHVDYKMGELQEVNRRESERVLQVVQQEQTKRTALEARLHSQLLLQSESMVAMELKLLRLEAKVAQRQGRQQPRQSGATSTGTTTTTADRLPPIAANAPSTPNQSDEEVDSFDELELTPRGTNRRSVGAGLYNSSNIHRGGMGPANIAVVRNSGASVASAVTAQSFVEEGVSLTHEDEGSDDGDIEDEGGGDNDGSASSKYMK